MKTLLVFCLCVATSCAALLPWSPSAEAEATRQFRKYCLDSQNSGRGAGASWECKRAGEAIEQELDHDHRLNIEDPENEQVVFVQIPFQSYQHNVRLSGNANRNTKVVIIPANDRQTVNINADQRGNQEDGPIFVARTGINVSGRSNSPSEQRSVVSQTQQDNRSVVESVLNKPGAIRVIESPSGRRTSSGSSDDIRQLKDLLRRVLDSRDF